MKKILSKGTIIFVNFYKPRRPKIEVEEEEIDSHENDNEIMGEGKYQEKQEEEEEPKEEKKENKNEKDNKKHIAYNKDSKLLDNGRKPEINVVKLSNNMSSGNIQYNNIIKRTSNKPKNVENSNSLGQMRKSDKKTKGNENNQSNDNNFNNISEIKYDQNSTDNEKIKKHVLDDNDDEYLSSSKYNSNSKRNKHKTEDREDNLKVKKFDLNDSKNNEEKNDSNLKKNDLTDSEFKKMKNNDGLDEFDNNFNNHDLFYSKMRKIFDE